MSMPAATDSSAGNVNLRIGASAMQQEPIPQFHWHSRNYLPHYEDVAVIQHVTFHLADSLPEKAIQCLMLELESLPEERRDSEHRRQVEAWIAKRSMGQDADVEIGVPGEGQNRTHRGEWR
jgi:hypothetical protein